MLAAGIGWFVRLVGPTHEHRGAALGAAAAAGLIATLVAFRRPQGP